MSKMIFSTTGSAIVFDGTTYYLTDLTYGQTANRIDVTDTGTSGDGTEFVYGRVERTISVDMWKDSASAGPSLKTKKACTIKFENNLYIGSASFESVEIAGSIDTGIKMTLAGVFEGSVSSSL